MSVPRLHLVTDAETLRDPAFPERARQAAGAGGADVTFHLRGHGVSAGELHRLAIELAPVILDTGGWFLVNDRVDLALALAARWPARPVGAHLGARSLPVGEVRRVMGEHAPIGYSAHALEEAVAATGAGATFTFFGAVFETGSHPGDEPAGTARLQAVADATASPVIAIGGVSPDRVAAVLAAGAHGVAALSGVWHARDSAVAVRRYIEALNAVTSGAANH